MGSDTVNDVFGLGSDQLDLTVPTPFELDAEKESLHAYAVKL